ncbi:hypothetical protein VTJ04DRAFT_5144 [Mycothermus thermophilus]|uniref:uncharacterized protein n=1 Tax=Humicola insolens TaxID=85995 RepID=UPI00374324A3
MDAYDATEDPAGGAMTGRGPWPPRHHFPQHPQQPHPHHHQQPQQPHQERTYVAYVPPPRFHSRQPWPTPGPWPKHDTAAEGPGASDHHSRNRPFRFQRAPPGPMRPSRPPHPLELRSDVNVPPDLVSARSDSFFYAHHQMASNMARSPCPSPTPTISHFPPTPRMRAGSPPTPRPPRSAFPGLSSNPFIPESSEPEPAAEPETEPSQPEPRPEPRQFPLRSSSATRHPQCDQLSRLTPVSNYDSPASSRHGTPTEQTMPVVENFSRPRKASIRSQASDGALSMRRMAAPRLHAEPTVSEEPPTETAQPTGISNPGPSPWNRRMSASSSRSTSTFSSSIPPRPSNDQLNATARSDFVLQPQPQPVIVPAPQTVFPRPPPPYSGPVVPQPQPRELPPWVSSGEEFRSSFRSQFTSSTAQGTFFTPSGTERNSILTKASSITEQSIINGYARMSWRPTSVADDGLSLEDVMGMYERGFQDSDIESMPRRSMKFPDLDDDVPEADADHDIHDKDESRPGSSHSDASDVRAKVLEAMSDSLPVPTAVPIPASDNPRASRTRRSLLSSSLPKEMGLGLASEELSKRDKRSSGVKEKRDSKGFSDADDDDDSTATCLEKDDLASPRATNSPNQESSQDSSQTQQPQSAQESASTPTPGPEVGPRLPQEPPEDPDSRDRYGFRKAGANITRQEYDEWNAGYTEYLARRRKKWIAFLKDNSLMTDRPNRFPPRSAKTKRFIRKGIPPDWRGAAWFYYAGGPAILAQHRGVYEDLVRRAGLDLKGRGRDPNRKGEVKPLIVEDIEKDLYRTFPDNIRFKPPPPPPGSPPPEEPEIIASLRRVLNAFALYNPRIGYCQSLNFLAGLLLLFVETEEQAFWLLNIITRVYLPGTHEMSLEGSKVDLGVLMLALKESLPGVWKQIGGDEFDSGKKKKRGNRNGHGASNSVSDPNRLPAITLCMTAWFMSCFIGTLPIETVLRVWDVFFYEGSRTLFRIALTIFKLGEREIKAVQDPMEMFGVVQTFPRRMIDCNTLLETCYKRRNGIGHLSQDVLEERRKERRDGLRKWKAEQEAAASDSGNLNSPRPGTRHRLGLDLASDVDEVRKKANLFGRRKDREQMRADEVL